MKVSSLNQASQPITATPKRTSAVWTGRLAVLALAFGIFCLALLPRALPLGDFVTIDEASMWFRRSEGFLRGLQEGDYANTNQTGHPGVTTMWLGTTGVLAHQWLSSLGWIVPDDLTPYRVLLRLPVAIVTSLSVALGYLLLRRLFDGRVALLVALLWATEPFLVAHGQVIHLDGLLTSFMMLSLLAALLAFRLNDGRQTTEYGIRTTDDGLRTIHWRYLVASAVVGGLALLTKSPSVLLLPMIGLIALVGLWQNTAQHTDTQTHRRKDFKEYGSAVHPPRVLLLILIRATGVLCAWIGIALVTWLALWPATWVDLTGAVMSVVNEVIDNGGAPHNVGNFFLGRTVADPGPLFYPVTIALRLTPWTLAGLVIAGVALFQQTRAQRAAVLRGPWSVILLLALFAVIFTSLMSIPPKKFDRYVLPIFPALAIIAAVGWVWLFDKVRHKQRRDATSPRTSAIVWGGLTVALAANLAWYHPYTFAYYNPLLGGGPVAARTIPVGWGEGYEQAAAFINSQFNGCEKPVASWFDRVLRHFSCADVVPLGTLFAPEGDVGYAVLYIDQLQRNNEPEAIDLLYDRQPLHTVTIHGIEYAHVYQIAPPVDEPLEADFGSAIRLRGYAIDTSAVRASGTLNLTLQWYVQEPMATDYNLFVHVLDTEGNLVGQVDVPPNGLGAPTSQWQPDRYVTLEQTMPVAAEVPAGTYWIGLGIYDPATFARLPLRGPIPPAAPSDGPDALLIGPMMLE